MSRGGEAHGRKTKWFLWQNWTLSLLKRNLCSLWNIRKRIYEKKVGNLHNLGQKGKKGNMYCFRFGWSLLYLSRMGGGRVDGLNREERLIQGAMKVGDEGVPGNLLPNWVVFTWDDTIHPLLEGIHHRVPLMYVGFSDLIRIMQRPKALPSVSMYTQPLMLKPWASPINRCPRDAGDSRTFLVSRLHVVTFFLLLEEYPCFLTISSLNLKGF